MTNEPKSAEDAASEAANAFYNPKLGMSIEDVFHKGVAFQREREKGLILALEMYAMTNETFPEYGDLARAALLKYRGQK
jgi:hypothetical protein